MRRVVTFIGQDGRDKGKHFVITEMPAFQAERLATRALFGLARAGVDIGAVTGMGMAGIAAAGLQALPLIDRREAEPLLDEMMTCVQIMPDPNVPAIMRPILGPGAAQDDVEELTTILALRKQILDLHTDFSEAVAPSAPTAAAPTSSPSGQIVRTRPARSR